MAKMAIKRQIPTPDEAFSSMLGGQNKVESADGAIKISLSKLIDFQTSDGGSQPFRMYDDDNMEQLAENIKQNGVLQPIIVRQHKTIIGSYEIIAGHNRTKGARMAGLSEIPAIVMKLNDLEATSLMLDTNLNQRHELSYSELAFAYKMRLEVENAQGQRSDLTSRHGVAKLTQAERRKAQRYARLSFLHTGLLKMVDDKAITMSTGIEISYISEENQKVLYEYITEHKKLKFTDGVLKYLKQFNDNHIPFDFEVIEEVIEQDKDVSQQSKKENNITSTSNDTADNKVGALIYNNEEGRYDIRFDIDDYYGGLHCGECFEVKLHDKWISTRIEKSSKWYLVDIKCSQLTGLIVRK